VELDRTRRMISSVEAEAVCPRCGTSIGEDPDRFVEGGQVVKVWCQECGKRYKPTLLRWSESAHVWVIERQAG
jgi:uncharacterized Zn finger protein